MFRRALLLFAISFGAPLPLPVRAQSQTPAPSAPAAAQSGGDAQSVRDRWNALTPDEQRRVMDNYEHWKKLSPDDRALMRRRFDRLETERRRARDLADPDDRRSLERMHDGDRRRELTRRAKASVRERFEQLPPDLRDRIERELAPLPPPERARRLAQAVRQHVDREVRERLGRKVASGELSRDAVDELRRQANQVGEDPRARLELLRKFLVDHPDAFHLTPEQRERLQNEKDPGLGLRLLDRLRRRRGRGN